MAGNGPAPKVGPRRGRAKRERGDWTPPVGVGWQHGQIPDPPDGLTSAGKVAWETWLAAWFAAYWTPDDLPGLRQLVRLYDQVERGQFQRASEMRIQMDTYGITPKGQQDRRWKRVESKPEGPPASVTAIEDYRSMVDG